MKAKTKTVTIENVEYAMAVELGESRSLLERLAAEGKVGKVIWNGFHYYAVNAVRENLTALREVPTGWVRAVEHATLLGADRRTAQAVCASDDTQAGKFQNGPGKPVWFANKEWLERQLGVTKKPVNVETPSIQDANARAIQHLQKTIDELRDAIQTMAGTKKTAPKVAKPLAPTVDQALAEGYRPLQDLASELEIAPSTVRGWRVRGQVRSYKIGGRYYLHTDDVEQMYMKLDDNRDLIKGRMGDKYADRGVRS